MEAKITPLIASVTKPKGAPTPQLDIDQTPIKQSSSVTSPNSERTTRSIPIDDKVLHDLLSNLNQHIQTTTRALSFHIDKHYARPIVTVIDKDTGEVIRQIPLEVALQIADAFDAVEDATGTLISERA